MKAVKKISPDATSLISAAADTVVALARSAIAKRGVFHIALAGGSTPKGLYQRLAMPEFSNKIDWSRVHIYFGDERCVLPTDDDSNYKMAKESMLDYVPIPEQNVHRFMTENGVAADVAKAYMKTLEESLQSESLDLVLLGLGPDGHVASLFPDTPALDVTDASVTSLYVEKFESWRVTMTYPTINAARQVIVFIAGEAKAAIVKDISSDAVVGLPVQRLNPEGEYYWYMDSAAAES